MTLTQLSYIVAVDKYRHFATAAEKIFVTQPTLSMQIHKLEEQLGVKLFDRSRSPVVPTDIGRTIIDEAKTILKQAKKIEDLAHHADGKLSGPVHVGIIPTITPYLVPLVLQPFMKAHPDVELIFEEMLTSQVLEGLHQDTLDIGIIATPTDQKSIHEEILFDEPFVGYLSQDHPLSQKKLLDREDLDGEGIWLLNEGHCLRDQTLKLCKEERRNRHKDHPFRFESGNLETLKRLVEQNYGMTLMPALAVRDYSRNCSTATIREFAKPVPSRRIRLAYSREYLKDSLVPAWKEIIQTHLPDDIVQPEERLVLE